MIQVAVIGLTAVIGWRLWRSFGPVIKRRSMVRSPRHDAKTLERDPKTGVYQPVERD